MNILLCILKLLKKNSVGAEWIHLSCVKKFSFKFEADSFRKVLGYGKSGGRDLTQIPSDVTGKEATFFLSCLGVSLLSIIRIYVQL